MTGFNILPFTVNKDIKIVLNQYYELQIRATANHWYNMGIYTHYIYTYTYTIYKCLMRVSLLFTKLNIRNNIEL